MKGDGGSGEGVSLSMHFYGTVGVRSWDGGWDGDLGGLTFGLHCIIRFEVRLYDILDYISAAEMLVRKRAFPVLIWRAIMESGYFLFINMHGRLLDTPRIMSAYTANSVVKLWVAHNLLLFVSRLIKSKLTLFDTNEGLLGF